MCIEKCILQDKLNSELVCNELLYGESLINQGIRRHRVGGTMWI